jgi:sucrose-6-phosphate hydrolase SacC (GH32 family)
MNTTYQNLTGKAQRKSTQGAGYITKEDTQKIMNSFRDSTQNKSKCNIKQSRNLYNQSTYNMNNSSVGSFQKDKKTSYYDQLFSGKLRKKTKLDTSKSSAQCKTNKFKEKVFVPSRTTIDLIDNIDDSRSTSKLGLGNLSCSIIL